MNQEARLDYLIDYLLNEDQNKKENFKDYKIDTIEEKLMLIPLMPGLEARKKAIELLAGAFN